MVSLTQVKEHMEVVGADGVHVGTVDAVEKDRIKLTKQDSGVGSHKGHHHYLPAGIVAEVEGNQVRLSATGANALMFREESSGKPAETSGHKSSGSYSNDAGATNRQATAGVASGANWNKIGIAAVAIAGAGAAAAAALQQRKKRDVSNESGKDYELRLSTDETVRLISSSKVEGTPVVGRDGEKLGTIQSFMVDKYTGRVAYAVMAFGGTLGAGQSLFPLPWSVLDYDTDKDGYALDLTKEQLVNAPKFEANSEPEFDAGYRRRVLLFYKR